MSRHLMRFMRLQGGPFDGSRQVDEDTPEFMFVEPCGFCGTHWWRAELPRSERYMRDVEVDGWLLYVWVDPRLSGISTSAQVQHSPGEARTREGSA